MLKKWLVAISILMSSNYALAFGCTENVGGYTTFYLNVVGKVSFAVRPQTGTRVSDWIGLYAIPFTCETAYKYIVMPYGVTGDTGKRVTEGGQTYPVLGVRGTSSFGVIIQYSTDGGGWTPLPWVTTSDSSKHVYSGIGGHRIESRAAFVVISNGQVDETVTDPSGIGVQVYVDSFRQGQSNPGFAPYDRRGGVAPMSLKVTYTYPTCDIATDSLNPVVSLPSVTPTAFSGVGSTVGRANLTLTLTCKRAIAGKGLDVFTAFTDMNTPANSTGVLSVSGGATGVGVQMTGPNGLITYGPETGMANRWKIGTSFDNSGFTIPISINYIQTSDTIKPGTAQARASYIISYN